MQQESNFEITSYKPEKAELKNLAAENFRAWNQALKSKDVSAVVALYGQDVSFLPTLSPDLKKDKEGTAAYFSHFLEKNPGRFNRGGRGY